MKKKILSICLVACFAIMAIAGASLAYLTDDDQATNTFTIGNVKIELNEQQRNDDGTALEEFEQNKELLPIVGSAQGEKDQFGMPVAENYQDKIITVKNTGKNNAYVRVIVAFPTALEEDPAKPAQNIIHFNTGNRFLADGSYEAGVKEENADSKNWTEKFEGAYEIDGIMYNLYSYTYANSIASGIETASACVVGFYVDQNANVVEVDGKPMFEKNGEVIDFDLTNGIKVPVFAQAIQADGFDSAADAFAASSLPVNPWAE